MAIPKEVKNLANELSRLPGVGPKLSMRLAIYLSISDKELAKRISNDIEDSLKNIKQCKICCNVTSDEVCDICLNPDRDSSKLIVVESSIDLFSLEQTNQINAKYHVLNGVISPINGIGPEDINIKSLLNRLINEKIEEVIFALNPNLEGDATSIFIKNEIIEINSKILVSRLGKGIPVGSSIEYMSTLTLLDSINNRDKI